MKRTLSDAEKLLLFEYLMRVGGSVEVKTTKERRKIVDCRDTAGTPFSSDAHPIIIKLEDMGWVSLDSVQDYKPQPARTLRDLTLEEACEVARILYFPIYDSVSRWHIELQQPVREEFRETFRAVEFYLQSKGTKSWFTFNYDQDYIAVHAPSGEVAVDMEDHYRVLEYLLSIGIKPRWYDRPNGT